MDNKIRKIINVEIRKDAREEALSILDKATEVELDEFLSYYDRDIINVCCLIIDKVKMRLVDEGIMTMSENDNFGHRW